MRAALVGNPNSGKTALFNALTGTRQKTANYPGVTVERKEGSAALPSGARLRIVDLPGTYSLRARSPDEEVTRDVVLGRLEGEALPDVLVAVADATNLRLVLRLILELRAVGRPMVLALNMIDIAERQGFAIDLARLSAELGCPVVTTVATRRRGVDHLLEAVEARGAASAADADWRAPDASALRASHREAERILKACVIPPRLPDTWTGRLDAVLLQPVAGLLILLAILFVMFQAVFAWAQPVMDALTHLFDALGTAVKATLPEGPLRALLADGVIAGVGSVIVFLPQIIILFFFIILLEDTGYMGRAAFLMDRLMGGAGLHGRAFIPLLSSFACAIPGIMSTRVIDNRRDRLTTILIAPLMTCSARIPVYTLIISAFVPHRVYAGVIDLRGLVMFGLYAAGIGSALAVAAVTRRFFWRGKSEPFLMELPSYKLPSAGNVLQGVYSRARSFLTRAGTTILAIMVVIWWLSSTPGAPAGATQPAIDYSFAGQIGHALAPVFKPIGFDWTIALALIPAFAAREVVVATLGTVYAVAAGGESSGALGAVLQHHWSTPTALSLLAWFVFAPQCASTLSVVRRETASWVWPLVMVGYMSVLAYAASFLVFHLATWTLPA
ncbi:MAG: ferrous iron transporter B [Caulobacteraceae bacterium]|nr:ferrous iron transporter B [Caulobacter sp.]